MRRYYSLNDIAALAEVTTYAELAKIGIGVLRRMSEEYKPKGARIVQICGPMSTGGLGDLDFNMAVFGTAIRLLDEAEYGSQDRPQVVVFNQIPCQGAIKAIANSSTQPPLK